MFSFSPLALVLGQAIFVSRAEAFSIFSPNCTLPPPNTNFVSAAGVRSTLDILWSSLALIILCTWNILHLNIPRIRGPASFCKKRWWDIVDAQTKVKWMLLTILVPELILAKAANELVAARWAKSYDAGKQRPVRNYLANMGYFVLDWGHAVADANKRRRWGEPEMNAEAVANPEILFEEHRSLFFDDTSRDIENSRLMSRYWAPNAAQWAQLRDLGIAQLPDAPEHLLEKLDSSGGMVKLLALVQIIWLVIQLSVRQHQGKPSSQLEIAAVAYAGQSLLTYVCYFTRPRDVSSICFIPARLPQFERQYDEHAVKIIPGAQKANNSIRKTMQMVSTKGPSYLVTAWRSAHAYDPAVGPAPIPNDAIHHGRDDRQLRLASSIVALGGVIFGGLHCLAWNSTFPTYAESVLWRVCAIATTVLPLTSAMIYGSTKVLDIFSPKRRLYEIDGAPRMNLWWKRASVGFLLLYILVRLCLIVEMFRTLFYLPPDVYTNTWASEIPHAG
jgi:hypothetical protein